MKILMAARRYPPDVRSGTETVFEALYARARARHDVRLVVGWRDSRELVPPEAVAVELRGLGKARQWTALSAAIAREVRRFQPDVVLSNSIEVPPTGAPTVCIVHDLNFGKASGGLGARLRRRFYVERARMLDRVVTVSVASANVLRDAGIDPARIQVIHNGVDVERFRPDPGARRLVDPEGLWDDKVLIAYPSRILPGKGQHHAIDAVARLPAEHKRRAHLVVVGAAADPVYLERIRTQAASQPVSFATDVPDIARYYQAADIVVYPTVMQEGFGFTAVEGMACGKPVVWFDQPAIREATAGLGVPVPHEDVPALRTAIQALMDDPARRQALGEEGLRYVRGNLDWDRVWERYEGVLGAVAR